MRQAPAEADILLGQMSRSGEIDLVMSEDMDMLCHGCERVLRLGEGSWERVEVYRLADVLSGLGVSLRGFVYFCILCGCDYSSRIKGVGPVKAMNMVQAIGDDLGVIEIAFRTAWVKYSPEEEFDEWMGEFRGALEIFLG